MVSGSCACTPIGNPKSVGRFPLTSVHDRPPSSDRITSQCFCMYSVSGRDGCASTWCTQCPTSAPESGMPSECSPRFTGRHVSPESSDRNVPAAEIAANIRDPCRMIVCRQRPPAPGCQPGADGCTRRPVSSVQVRPPSADLYSAASSPPAYTVSGSSGDGSRCQIRLNSHGRSVPSYHRCVPGSPPA